MKIFVIPDVHLKPWMFSRASDLLKMDIADKAVCLMDIADDWKQLWHDESPIWYRPQYYKGKMYKPRKLLQVVGHTPVREIYRDKNVVSCDVFSTDSTGKAVGSQQFLLIDTVTWEFEGVS